MGCYKVYTIGRKKSNLFRGCVASCVLCINHQNKLHGIEVAEDKPSLRASPKDERSNLNNRVIASNLSLFVVRNLEVWG